MLKSTPHSAAPKELDSPGLPWVVERVVLAKICLIDEPDGEDPAVLVKVLRDRLDGVRVVHERCLQRHARRAGAADVTGGTYQ